MTVSDAVKAARLRAAYAQRDLINAEAAGDAARLGQAQAANKAARAALIAALALDGSSGSAKAAG